MFHRNHHGWIALALGAALAAGPAFAEKGGHGHGGGKHEAKAEKHAMKEARKAEKHAAKAEHKAFKAQRQAERHARKDFDRDERHAWRTQEERHAWRDDRERQAARIMGAAPAPRAEVRVVPGSFFTDDHRRHARSYFVEHYGHGRGCPPGLAKKNNGCLPPGHAKRIVVGEVLPRGYSVYAVPQPVIGYLPPAPYGYRYVRVNDDIVLMAVATGIVVDVMMNLLG